MRQKFFYDPGVGTTRLERFRGGYGSKDLLADIPLQWIRSKAENAGLKLDEFNAADDAWKTDPRDSFKEFLGGVYAWFRKIRKAGDGRFFRRYSVGVNGKLAVNVSVDDSVWKRWEDAHFNYRPRTLSDAGQSPPQK